MSTSQKPWAPPSWRLLSLVAALFFALFLFDAVATTILIRRGMEEAMALPDTMLKQGEGVFISWKAWLSAFGGMLFLFSSRYQRWCWWITLMIVAGLLVLALLHAYFLIFFDPSVAD